jgi:hypothetical protein
MKIAICISGHLRHFHKLKDNFKWFKKQLQSISDVDVFVATWDKQNTLQSWSHAHGISNAETAKNIVNLEEVKNHYETNFVKLLDYDFYSSDYSPINYKQFTDQKYSWDSRGIGGSVVNSSKMFLLIHEANKLKKYQEFLQKQKYDLVIRTRPDYEYNNLSAFVDLKIKPNTIFCSKPYPDSKIDDQFGMGDSDSMDKYSACILKQPSIFHSNIWGNPEDILMYSLLSFHDLRLEWIQRVGFLGSDICDFKR